MKKFEALVIGVILTVIFNSVKCSSLSDSEDVRVKFYNDEDTLEKPVESVRRVTRQAYQGQNIYPSVPPYGSHQPQHSNYNNQYQGGPSYTQGHQNDYRPSNPYGTNYNHSGYPSHQGYRPSNFTTNYGSSYGQNTSWYPQNGQSQHQTTNSYPQYTTSQYPGYKPGNHYNPSSTPSYYPGQSNNTYPGHSQQPPYHQPSGNYPQNTNSTQYPGYRPGNNYSPSSRPSYPGQSNNTYQGYPGYGQNSPQPGHQNPVVYDDSTRRPGQNSYGSTNSTNSWNTLNNTRPGYGNNGPNNGYPNSPGYGSPNLTNPYNPSQSPFGQNGYPSFPGNYKAPSNYPGSNPYSGYPGSPSNPGGQVASPYNPYPSGPYGSPNGPPNGPPQGYYDPTKVSPHHFNAY